MTEIARTRRYCGHLLTDAEYLDALRQTARGYWEEIENGRGSPKLRAKLSAIEEEIEDVLCSLTAAFGPSRG